MNQTNAEVAKALADKLRAYRVSPRGAGMTQTGLARKSGIGLTPLKRFEATGGITLNNLIAIMRALGLLDRIAMLAPDPDTPSPMEVLHATRRNPRVRAPRRRPSQ